MYHPSLTPVLVSLHLCYSKDRHVFLARALELQPSVVLQWTPAHWTEQSYSPQAEVLTLTSLPEWSRKLNYWACSTMMPPSQVAREDVWPVSTPLGLHAVEGGYIYLPSCPDHLACEWLGSNGQQSGLSGCPEKYRLWTAPSWPPLSSINLLKS